MIASELLGIAAIPGGGELKLMRRVGSNGATDYMIVLGGNELMNSRMRGSEEALAEMTLAKLGDRAPHILIGGYGMGFTLRKALSLLGPDALVTVAELVPEILDWARGPMAALTGDGLDDPRVQIAHGDVGFLISSGQGRYDAILLDVDNGPDGLVRDENNRLYSKTGLAEARAALRPGGVLAIWSAAPDAVFTNRLRRARFQVEEVVVRARENGKGPRHVIWFATRA
ncbi:spermidine synthase [Polymorphobacter fuscus]|uniref:Spermidine synthase n=1 Tax=Sandarakinorhabdus fusca TaxID=1439888 RepID=A0A7C9KUP5_9SPHN|nr:spermidine synthase [Polymorphobacter fuscus]KAB7648168.1 spermidine synthase [Polymorphobacter fuscus]MQT15665.1 spermidine synthase [Polymorphobacter fuscus]NJC08065.1 spermidine synthase [Polymorphobacter fuscus]